MQWQILTVYKYVKSILHDERAATQNTNQSLLIVSSHLLTKVPVTATHSAMHHRFGSLGQRTSP